MLAVGTSRRLRQRVLGLGESPVEPQGECLDVGALHRRAAPDAQARRRVTISIDVEGDALLLQHGVDASQSAITLALASARAINALSPPIDFAQASVSR